MLSALGNEQFLLTVISRELDKHEVDALVYIVLKAHLHQSARRSTDGAVAQRDRRAREGSLEVGADEAAGE